MLRRLFTFVSMLSLVLCVAACAMRVRNCFAADEVKLHSSVAVGEGMQISDFQLLLGRGRLHASWLGGKFKTAKISCRTPGTTVHLQRQEPYAHSPTLPDADALDQTAAKLTDVQ
ncbi:MAG TPA: hypothetical protein VG269_22035 [Tepidisphaeraceae bacterium]|jgi:hypothetical protein|nr:hypothetical protein [Tepidisphaeraceae bacterium]